ncbi:MAG: amidohydrolase family protein [Chloroflexi bacterium]|uniref:amidohydrolase family protein n=1 Tax=Candidatus Flexifilum breve TaxID=3140694 RepID=UPI003136FD9A|nr:amidohydrolase family protein [Chloroflexota bacterium]
MPEPAAWRYQKIIRPMFDLPVVRRVFVNARVLTMVGDQVIESGFVEIENGKIKAVGAMSDLGSTDAQQIDCTGMTIMPGMINSHAHLAWDGVHDLARQSMDDAVEISAYKSASNMLKNLRAGVTLVRDLGMNKANFFAKQAIEQGIFPGPRLLICGEAIIQTGGHTYWCCREASGADEMRRAVREQVRGGADLIKIMACHDTLEFTDAELEAVIDESHRNGLPITAHATYNDCINRVAQFGVDCVEHGGSMTDDTIQILVDKKIPIVTTFAPLVMQANEEVARKFNIPEWKIEERKKAVANPSRYTGLVNAAKAGVPIAFGTDAGSPAVGHEIVAPELKFMVKIGVVTDNYAALRSATIVAARISQLDSKIGTLEAGKDADLIVIDGNPLADLDALERVQATYIAGKQMIGVGN